MEGGKCLYSADIGSSSSGREATVQVLDIESRLRHFLSEAAKHPSLNELQNALESLNFFEQLHQDSLEVLLKKLQTAATLAYFLPAFRAGIATLAAHTKQIKNHQIFQFAISIPCTLKNKMVHEKGAEVCYTAYKKKIVRNGTKVFYRTASPSKDFPPDVEEILPNTLVFITPLGSALWNRWKEHHIDGMTREERRSKPYNNFLRMCLKRDSETLESFENMRKGVNADKIITQAEKQEMLDFINFLKCQSAEIQRYFAFKESSKNFYAINWLGNNNNTYKGSKNIIQLESVEYRDGLYLWMDDLAPLIVKYLPHFTYTFKAYVGIYSALIKSDGEARSNTKAANSLLMELFTEVEAVLNEGYSCIEQFYDKTIATLHAVINKQDDLSRRKEWHSTYLRVLLGNDHLPFSLKAAVSSEKATVASTSGYSPPKKTLPVKKAKRVRNSKVRVKAFNPRSESPSRVPMKPFEEQVGTSTGPLSQPPRASHPPTSTPSSLPAYTSTRLPRFPYRYSDNIRQWFNPEYVKDKALWDIIYHTYPTLIDHLIVSRVRGEPIDDCIEYLANGEMLYQKTQLYYFVIYHLIASVKDNLIFHRGVTKLTNSEYDEDKGKRKIKSFSGSELEECKKTLNTHQLAATTMFRETLAYYTVHDQRNNITFWVYK
jgi:hypothetical protein